MHPRAPSKPLGPKTWPESCGFLLTGDGPCYVISVSRGGAAHKAGLCPGDEIIELDERNVIGMSADSVRTLARCSSTQPPAVGVVSRVQVVELRADRQRGYGMSVSGVRPCLVGAMDPSGPAYLAGIRTGN